MDVAALQAFRDEIEKIALPTFRTNAEMFAATDAAAANRPRLRTNAEIFASMDAAAAAQARPRLRTNAEIFANPRNTLNMPAQAAAPAAATAVHPASSGTWMKKPTIQSASPAKVVARFARKAV